MVYTRETGAGGSLEFKANLVYVESSRPSGALQQDPVSNFKRKKK